MAGEMRIHATEATQPGEVTHIIPVSTIKVVQTLLPAGSTPTGSFQITGPGAARLNINAVQGPKGDTGIPGPTAVPADTAVASYINSGTSKTRAAADAHYAQTTHAASHQMGGSDALTIDARQVVSPMRDWVRDTLRRHLAYSIDSGFRMVFMGDSHTNDGALELSPTGLKLWGGGKGYSYRVANLLTAAGPRECQAGVSVTKPAATGSYVWESATGGYTSANYAPVGTLDNIGTLQPHMVVHMIGTNDFLLQSNPDRVIANITAALNGVWSRVPAARQMLIIPWPVDNPAGATYSWSELAAKLRALANSLAGDARFDVLDYGARFERLGQPFWPNDLWSILPDDIHGDGNLHRDLAERLAEYLGLPSPAVVFGHMPPHKAPAFTSGASTNPVATLTVPALPVPRAGEIDVTVLAAVSGESDFKIATTIDGVTSEMPFHVQAQGLRSYTWRRSIEIPPRKSATIRLYGSALINVYAGSGFDQYNSLTANLRYI